MSNLETVQAIYDAFGQGNVPAILDQLAAKTISVEEAMRLKEKGVATEVVVRRSLMAK